MNVCKYWLYFSGLRTFFTYNKGKIKQIDLKNYELNKLTNFKRSFLSFGSSLASDFAVVINDGSFGAVEGVFEIDCWIVDDEGKLFGIILYFFFFGISLLGEMIEGDSNVALLFRLLSPLMRL